MDEEMKGLDCPKCAGTMEEIRIGNVEVDRCVLCRGIWFDANECAKLKAIPSGNSVDDGSSFIGSMKDSKQGVDCPICHVRMVTIEAPSSVRDGLLLERCPKCNGMFFDAGEFRDFSLDEEAISAMQGGG